MTQSHSPTGPVNVQEKDLQIIGKHLLKAHQSNALAVRLQQRGFASDALQQHQLTKVFLNNALYYVKQRSTTANH
jgi:hypothetical protein